MLLYWLESVRLLFRQLPVFGELWTYTGIPCASGALIGIIRSFVVFPLMLGYSNDVHVFVATIVVAGTMWLALKGMRLQHPAIITLGGICMSLGFWPTLRLEFLTLSLSVALILVGIVISLPIFIREIKIVESSLNSK